MELLEREEALAALSGALDEAARGDGRVALVTGEPGIGKTALVTRFVRDLGPEARVLFGACDDLAIPRPLGPFRDVASSLSSPLEEALSTGAAAHEIQKLVIAELELPPGPTVLVLEDVHWADDATLDLLTVVGRRIGTLPALMLLTYRGGEARSLRAAIGAIRADDSVFLELAPLSERAVASLAGQDAARVFAATGGNPFYVTELIDSRPADLPPSVANAVLGRASRLDETSRHLVELVSVVPGRVATSLLDSVMPGWPPAAEEPERRQLLEIDARHVRFRHELARNAIQSSVPIATRRRLHTEILQALLAAAADPADIVHHAEAAGDEHVVAEYALVAARQAAAVESNREAHAHYRRAVDLVDRRPLPEQATMLEEAAMAASLASELDDAFPAVERAIEIYSSLQDAEAVGRCKRMLARFHWFAGEGEPARARAYEAIAILEPLGESVELARAYSGLSALAMLDSQPEEAIRWGERGLDLATRLGDESTQAHALVNLGTMQLQLDHTATAALLRAHAFADATGESQEATRALNNLAGCLLYWSQGVPASRFAQQALVYAEDHEVHHFISYDTAMLGFFRLRAGEWDAAERITRAELQRGIGVSQLLARTTLTELAVRRGDPDSSSQLADLRESAKRSGDLQRLTPVLELAIERALTSDAAMPLDSFEEIVGLIRSREALTGWPAARLAAWGAVAAIDVDWDVSAPSPLSEMAQRDWSGAARAFGGMDWPYDRALMLSLLDDEESLTEAIGIARELGADPLTRRVATRMRELGMSVPHGPRQATLANPAGLTARQLEVLSLLAEGLTNAEIADRLVVSPRTAEHHVAAVMTKLGVATRREAARRASELGPATRT